MGGGANRQPGLPGPWLPSLSQVCPAQKAGWSLWQRHPQPCCHPALFKDNPHGAQLASVSPPGKGEFATPRVPGPTCSSSLHLGLFWELLVRLSALQGSITVTGMVGPLHPHLLPLTRGGRSQPALGTRGMGSWRGVLMHTQGTGKVPALMAAVAQSLCRKRWGCHRPPLPWEHQWLHDTPSLGVQRPARDTARLFPAQLFAQSIPWECSSCHAPVAQEGPRSLPCQRCIPPAPWQRAEQLVQSGCSQKAL